ncbi:ESCRT-III subunit protein did4 [Podila epigama]|nr:ESCRT-III subunit protein did4 [Podila epigama]
MLNYLLGRKSPAEALRAHQRALNRAQRELDRERMKLEKQESKIVADIKRAAKAGQMNACKVMAKDLIRTRRHVQKFYQMKTQLQAVGLRIQSMNSSQQMAQAMKGATRAMGTMNKSMNLPQIQQIMMAFEKESEIMDMKDEMMSDTIDEAVGEEDDEEEQDGILEQVLDEIGLDISGPMAAVPRTAIKSPLPERERIAVAAGSVDEDAEEAALMARLDSLRRE